MRIEWIENTRGRMNGEVYVRDYVSHGDVIGTVVVFRDGSYKKITDRGAVLVGVTPDRLYFDEATPGSGYSLRSYNKGRGKFVAIRKKLPEWNGSHRLVFDADQKLWYVNKRG